MAKRFPSRSFETDQSSLERGVSLVEVLVSIGIITVLAALIFPTAKGVRSMSRQTQCVAHLRAIGVGQAAYAAENNGDWAWVGNINAVNDSFYRQSYELLHAANPSRWPGLGKIYKTGTVPPETFFCPEDKSARIRRAFEQIPSWEGSLSMTISSTYLLRAHEQTEGYVHLGRKLRDLTRRAVAACYFNYEPEGARSGWRVLNYHSAGWPTLYGDGSVRIVPIPSFINRSAPPTIQGNSSLQIRIWEEMDRYLGR